MTDIDNRWRQQHGARPVRQSRLAAPGRVAVLIAGAMAVASVGAHAGSDIDVPRDFPSIQAAVTAAPAGATIKVRPGTYAEEIVVGRDIILKGAGANETIIVAPPALTPYGVDGRSGQSLTAIVRIGHGAHVRMSGFTVSGPIPCGLVTGIAVLQAATLDLSDSRVRDIQPASAACPGRADGRSVVFGAPPFHVIDGQQGSTGFGQVTHVVVDGYLTEGLVATGPPGGQPSSVTFAGNTVISRGAKIPADQIGIDVFLGAAAQVTGNIVSGAVCTKEGCGGDPINEFQAFGIIAGPAAPGTRIYNNHVTDTDIGIGLFQATDCRTVSDNKVQDTRFFGIVVQDGDGAISENTIDGTEVGIGVVADAVDTAAVLHKNTVKHASMAPVQEVECCGFTARAIVK